MLNSPRTRSAESTNSRLREPHDSYHALPPVAGIGLRGPHMCELLESHPDVGWLEVHSENFFGDGGAPIHNLLRAREAYPISLHGVGLSIGSTDELDTAHLSRLDIARPGTGHTLQCSSPLRVQYYRGRFLSHPQ